MRYLIRLAIFAFIICEFVHSLSPKRKNHHTILVSPPHKLSKTFLEAYGKRCIEMFNKQSSDTFKYVLLEVVGGRANEETKSLEIMAKFGKTRCQKTEDRYFCQTAPELRLEEKLFKVSIQKKSSNSSVEFNFEEEPVEMLPVMKKLYVINEESD